MNNAELLISTLSDYGVSSIYALCGNGLDSILDASHSSNMRIIDTRNEQAASYMADVTGRLTRRLGVAAVSSGIAHINALTGVGNAWFDGSPMLLITGASDSAYRRRGNFQDMETVDLARSICKYVEYVDRSERLTPALHTAIAHAITGRPGPVHLTIPTDVLTANAVFASAEGSGGTHDMSSKSVVRRSARADEKTLLDAIKLIAQSKAPLILAGSGAYYAKARDQLAALASELHAPVMVPIWDRGIIDRPIPEYCGVIGAASGEPDILSKADMILLVGAEVDYRISYLESPAVRADASIVRIDADSTQMYDGVTPKVALHGDPAETMKRMVSKLPEVTDFALNADARNTWLGTAKNQCESFYGQFTEPNTRSDKDALSGGDVVAAFNQAITDETFLLVDGGNIGQWFHMLNHDRYPEKWITCGRSAVVGWGFPAAAAVSSLNPGKRVLLLSGDGSSTFTIAEIENAVRQNLPYVAVVADDSAWGIVVSGSTKRNAPAVASKLGSIEFARVAEGFGATGVRVDDVTRLAPEIEKGFASGKVTIIHVPIRTGGPADAPTTT